MGNTTAPLLERTTALDISQGENALPYEITLKIIEYTAVDAKTLLNFSTICTHWYTLIVDVTGKGLKLHNGKHMRNPYSHFSNMLWKKLVLTKWPTFSNIFLA
jgi:hypothetical protein